MSKIYEDFLKYQDNFGLTGLEPHNGSQNGALFTMEYLIHLMDDDETTTEVRQMELARLRRVFESLENFPGVSARKPNDREFDSMDNTNAIETFSALYDEGKYSKRSYEHGDKTFAAGIETTQDAERSAKYYNLARVATALFHCWNPISLFRFIKSGFKPNFFWNNNTPSLFCFFGWHGRSPGHIAFLKMTAGKLVGPLGILSIWIGQFLGTLAEKNNADARKLSYITWQYLKTRGMFWKWSYKLWCYILMKQYSNGMKDVYDHYYQDPNHPIHKYAKPYIK